MKVTLGQFEPSLGNKQANLNKITRIMEQASNEDSELVVFPELGLTGYFIQDVDSQMAEPIDGDSIRYIQQQCKHYNVHVVLPWPELSEDGRIYNAACLISNHGEIIGTYRKVHLYDKEKEVFTPGDDFFVFDSAIGKIGIMICFDLDFPETARTLQLKGADIIVSPTNNMEPYQVYQDTFLKSRSMENEIPIVLCNRVGGERDLTFFGESAAYDAFGRQVTKLRSSEKTETIEVGIHQPRDKQLQYRENRAPKLYGQLLKS
ncbi:carbon-nitrogen hydrolase family protein [Oceanobacillus halotolerans]|uniref:carbon-nitrogen hydrolase family protein n=1 Tax=Oceanobacillus halotolerans TaxID=2663380 RepID=UPI0013D8EEFB|nr:carbon-nitrogen hydrolase family protein [Oceanobacillus halotolerans]